MAHGRKPMLVTERCFAAMVRDYMASPKFSGDSLSPATKELWGRYLNFAARPNCLGAILVDDLRPALVQAYIDGLSGKPGVQAASLSAIRSMEKWACRRDILHAPITWGVEVEESDGGHIPWTQEHVTIAERHCRADFARVVTLGANTGQRGSDLIRMGWSDIETYKGQRGIQVTQKKTGREVWIPITDELSGAMQSWEKQPGPFLKKLDGHPWTRTQLTAAWTRQKDGNPELKPLQRDGLVLHGLRGHACVRLLRLGANTRQISDWVGMSEAMVKNYTRFSEQRDNALAVVHLLSDKSRKMAS